MKLIETITTVRGGVLVMDSPLRRSGEAPFGDEQRTHEATKDVTVLFRTESLVLILLGISAGLARVLPRRKPHGVGLRLAVMCVFRRVVRRSVTSFCIDSEVLL